MDTAQHLDQAIASLQAAYAAARQVCCERVVLCAMRRQLRELQALRARVGAAR